MAKTNLVWNFILHNRYWIVIIIGVLQIGFLDDNSFMTKIQYDMQISDLEEKIDQLNQQYERDEQRLSELRHNPKAITKIARESYMMKADNEDIFVLSDDERNTTTTTDIQNETTD